MKICILSCFDDLMLRDTGSAVRIYNLAKGLASLGHEVRVVIPKEKMSEEHSDGFVVESVRGFYPKSLLRIFSRFLGVSRPTALFFYDLLFIKRVGRIVRDYDIVQMEQQSAGFGLIPITRILKKPFVFDCHDTFQALRVKHTSFLRKLLETLLEKIAYRYSSVILVVSEKERELLVSYGIDSRKIHVVPNGTDTRMNHPQDIASIKNRYDLNSHVVVFVGNMEYAPNQEAVEVIAKEVAPRVQKEISDVKFLIVGRTTPRVESLGLTFTGPVKNVSGYLAASNVAIAPLFHGSGTRLKILEYFSFGLAVVSTSIGVEGLDIKNGVHAIVEDNIDTFALRIIELLNDKKLSMKLGSAAKVLANEKYDWKNIVEHLSVLVQETVRPHVQRRRYSSQW